MRRVLPNLDLLRSVAVSLVVLEHTLIAHGVMRLGYANVPSIGVVGVFMFFVHTSLVLMWSLERKPLTLDFYIRRVFRIYPLAVLAILVAVLLHAPVTNSAESYFYYRAPSALGLIANCLLVQDYVHQSVVVGVTWTLTLEMQMYLLLPVLFFFVRKNRSQSVLLFLWAFSAVFALRTFRMTDNNFATAIPFFIPGVMAYAGFSHRRPRVPAWLLVPYLLLLTAAYLIHPNFRVGWLVALALGLLLPSFKQIRAKWLIRGSHTVAKYSYGMYLTHPFALVVGVYLMPHAPVVLQLAIEMLVIAAASVGAYHLLEKPMIDLGARLAQKAEFRYEQVAMSSEL